MEEETRDACVRAPQPSPGTERERERPTHIVRELRVLERRANRFVQVDAPLLRGIDVRGGHRSAALGLALREAKATRQGPPLRNTGRAALCARRGARQHE